MDSMIISLVITYAEIISFVVFQLLTLDHTEEHTKSQCNWAKFLRFFYNISIYIFSFLSVTSASLIKAGVNLVSAAISMAMFAYFDLKKDDFT